MEDMKVNKQWDLITDGLLWRKALHAFPNDLGMAAMAEALVLRLQENADRADPRGVHDLRPARRRPPAAHWPGPISNRIHL